MSVDPQTMTPDAALQGLASAQEAAQATQKATEDLLELLGQAQQPANFQTVVLSATTPIVRDEASRPSMSLGILNPSPVVIFLGIGGGRASEEARAVSVPPGAGLVLPVAVEDLEIGARPTELAGGEAVVFLMRFTTVQPFYFWRA